MNAARFKQLLEDLSPADWESLADGQSLLMVDDHALAPGAADSARTLYRQPPGAALDADRLRDTLLEQAAELLDDYYRRTPLSREGFDRQVEALIDRHGAEVFVALDGRRAPRTLFVDGGTVVAEGRDSPRHPYGACCELDRPADIDRQVSDWLSRGEAYERYLSMNVCRYNC